ncbi:UNVERIFIED_CONTAM: hypothetical protein K2H54_040214 [Gekko kuhli]
MLTCQLALSRQITQIGIGVLETAFGLVITMTEQISQFQDGLAHLATPYWMGILYIISGSLSVVIAKKPEIPLVKVMLGMNVVSAMAAGIAVAIVTISLMFARYYSPCNGYYDSDTPVTCQESPRILSAQLRYMSLVLLMFTVLEFLIAIVTAAFGCASLCRNTYSETTIVMFQNTAEGTPPAVPTPIKEDEVH